MSVSSHSKTFGFGVTAFGVFLAFVSAVVPVFETSYRLMFDVFLVGITPYLLYGIVVVLLRHVATIAAGGVLLLLHGALVYAKRFLDQADYSDGMIHLGSMVIALLLIPLLITALREPWHG